METKKGVHKIVDVDMAAEGEAREAMQKRDIPNQTIVCGQTGGW